MRRCSAVVAFVSLAAVPALLAQECTPAWDPSVGTPGASSGYVGSMIVYQGDLVASGSFPDMAGVANSQYLARYNRSTQTWSSFGAGLGSGISNAFGTSFAVYGGDLFVGGFYADAEGVADTKSISRWDGTQFHSLGTGWAFDSVNAVWSLLSTDAIGGQSRLYIGGGFDNIAGQAAGCLAMWDGTTLTPLADSMTLVGINPLVTALCVFDDGQGGGPQLYASGRFSAVGSVAANMIARWNGTEWSAVGTNLTPRNAAAEIDCMVAYDDGTGPALYIGGTNLRVNGDGVNRATAKWDGLTWSPVGQALTGRTWSLATWDDGSGVKLYAAGTQAAVGYLYRLDSNVWTALDGGGSAQGIKLLVDGNTLYAGGSFTTVGGQSVGRIVARTGCPAACPADYNGDNFLDFFDYDDFVQGFESGDDRADFNGDGFLDFFDYDDFVTAFETGC